MDFHISIPPVIGFIGIVFFSYGGCILFHRIAGASGLIMFQVLSIVIANIQAMKTIMLPFFPTPVAMGTEIMMVSFFASDLLCEHYGPQKAKQGILLSFIGYTFFTILLFITTKIPVEGDVLPFFVKSHSALKHLFTPAPAFLIASISAFSLSQLFDIWIFSTFKAHHGDKRLGLRTFISTTTASFLDSVIFALLAWVVFAPTPLPLRVVFMSYIGGTFGIRLLLSMLQIPLMYFAQPQKHKRP